MGSEMCIRDRRYIKSIDKGLLKVMSKMGISTYQSYCGAQIFDAVGLSTEFIDQYFSGTASKIEGVGIDQISKEAFIRHDMAYNDIPILRHSLDVGGEYAVRHRGEAHAWTSDEVTYLQHATRLGNVNDYKDCLLYTSPSPRDLSTSRMPSSA